MSRPTYHSSGHVYFSIKDSQSQISAVMFKGNAIKLKFRLEEGMKVILFGAVTLYKPRGAYQINVSHVEAAGVGNLALAFKQLKAKLESEGLFSLESKKPKPQSIGHMIIITSATGAALQDMLRLVSKRWPMVKITLIDVLVQGEQAALKIAQAIEYANTLEADALVVSRGGGSVEDLWCFNEEIVARTLKASKHFTVSAVGHEIDWVITDYVADMRAATPTAAMELLLPDQYEYMQTIDRIKAHATQTLFHHLQKHQKELDTLRSQFEHFSITQKLKEKTQEIKRLKEAFNRQQEQFLQYASHSHESLKTQMKYAMDALMAKKSQELKAWQVQYEHANPAKRDQTAYAELNRLGKKVALEDLSIGDRVDLVNSKIKVHTQVESIEPL